MHNVTERVYIFSVYNSTRDDKLNEEVHNRHLDLLKSKGYTPTTVLGRYAGKDEKSILLFGTNLTESVVEEISKAQLQESYLTVYYDGFSELVFSNGARKGIGTMKQVTEEEAKSKDAFSKIGSQWFIVE
jgi:hydrogenase maturation factor HypF (carbamoyltransferase family)